MSLIIRSSAIHAAGCYTTSPIAAGTRVIEYTGRIVDEKEGDELYQEKDYTYLFAREDGRSLVDGYGMAMFINHSCDPNCETEELDGHIWITAARDIAPGEELTYDYNLFDGAGPATCSCGAAGCRGTMYSLAEIRKRKHAAARRGRRKEKTRNARQPAA